jgi:cell wall-associated protease
MKLKLLMLLLVFVLVACQNSKSHLPITANQAKLNTWKISDQEMENWFKKDIVFDSIPGISLYRAYDTLLTKKRPNSIIVAVLDGQIDSNHTDLKNHIWTNENEIADNQIDDDNNAYVDDIHGWNFLGNSQGSNIKFASIESIRIIQQLDSKFKGKVESEISENERQDFLNYKEAQINYEDNLKLKNSDVAYGLFLSEGYPVAKKELEKIFPKGDYNIQKLDSLYRLIKNTDKDLAKHVYFINDCLEYDITEEWIESYNNDIDSSLATTYNLNFYDRLSFDPKPNNLNFTAYGNPYINKNADLNKHSTKVSSLVLRATKYKNNPSSIQIMPLAISPFGSEHDKDIALAIKYAVDNGASIINMSFSKELSLHKKWILDAIKYASDHEVLIVTSSGNSYKNIDAANQFEPNDRLQDGNEISDNFVVVGSSSPFFNKYLFSYYSNYGKRDVDIFAPGENIKVAMPDNKDIIDSGTSLSAAITSGVAALIRSYYPDLTASQVKHILMDSGIEYTLEVSTPTEEDPDKTTPFNQLSKSGKVLNAYNALLMAERISKGK